MISFCRTLSNRLVARALPSRTASILCGVLFLAPLANIACAADTNTVIETVLGDAITQTQNLVLSMSQGCSGGANGVPPVSWGNLQPHGNSAVNALNDLRRALAKGQTANAVQLINSAAGELDALVNGAHDSCSGGSHGQDPVNYTAHQMTRITVKAKLDVLKLLLGS